MMNERRKSDRPVVPVKSPNKAGQPAAEGMEGRGLTKGNPLEQNASRTQSRIGAPSALERIRQAASKDKEMRFTALFHHIYAPGALCAAYLSLKREAAPGVDGETWRHYGEALEINLQNLSHRLKQGAYRAKPVRRVYIPKADGRLRPLGVTALEDKIVQRAAVEVLNAIYETDFLGFSYGFRPKRSQHNALDALYTGLLTRKVNWVLDLDIRGFLETSSYCPHVHEMLSNRPGGLSITLMRRPLRRPLVSRTASSSPRFTRCNPVWRERPSFSVVSSMGRYTGSASSTKRARNSSVMRICQGAPGVTCSPAMKPSLSHRCIVEVLIPRIFAACRMDASSPVDCSVGG